MFEECLRSGVNITDVEKGIIRSERYPSGYPANRFCIWRVQVGPWVWCLTDARHSSLVNQPNMHDSQSTILVCPTACFNYPPNPPYLTHSWFSHNLILPI